MSFIQSLGFEDAFDKLIADNTQNELDLASHYPYSQERWRFFSGDPEVSSNRIFLQYNQSDSRYQHQRFNGTGDFDVHTLVPAAGELLTFRTAERLRYTVGYEGFATMAFSINQSLQTGDTIRMGFFRNGDGYGYEFNGSLGDNTANIFILRNGTKVADADVPLERPVTEFTRFGIGFAWYNIGRAEFIQTYTDGGTQFNDTLGKLSVSPSRGPRTGNLPITAEIEPDGGTTGLEANVGSTAFQTFGDVNNITRDKSLVETGLTYGGSGDWEPLLAIRGNPDLNIVTNELSALDVPEFTGDDDLFLTLHNFGIPNVTDGGGSQLTDADFSVPELWSETNNSLEVSTAVDQIVDSTGTLQTTTPDLGGHQLGFASLYKQTSGQGGNATTSQSPGVNNIPKRQLREDDYAVVLVRTRGATSGDVTLEASFEQDW